MTEDFDEIIKYLQNPLKYIPDGMYCTDYDTYIACPFWDIDPDLPDQENGYCYLMGSSDSDSKGLSLLWDGVKECHFKYDAPMETIED